MPAPLAKGIAISVAVLIAAGLAVYESPQVRQWIRNSRRKIAVAINNFGDGINREAHRREDISMTEDLGEEAEQRRRRAREELLRRRAILEAQRKRRTPSTVGSFDDLVDEDGRLKKTGGEFSSATATGIDVQESGIVQRRLDTDASIAERQFNPVPDVDVEEQRQLLAAIQRSRPRLDVNVPSEVSSTHPSESLVDLTPRSEFPDTDFDFPNHNEAEQQTQYPLSQSDYVSAMSSRPRTEGSEPDYCYMHPSQVQNPTHAAEPQPAGNTVARDVSPTSSVAASLNYNIRRGSVGVESDGTLSDVEYVRDVHTPVSWSEVGSVISSNDGINH
ncbi:hypothetical protein VTO42DRAFT_8438 [Malbranchea cinnamomea]